MVVFLRRFLAAAMLAVLPLTINSATNMVAAQTQPITQEQLVVQINAAIVALGDNATEAQVLVAINGVIFSSGASNAIILGALGIVQANADPNTVVGTAVSSATTTMIASVSSGTSGGSDGGEIHAKAYLSR